MKWLLFALLVALTTLVGLGSSGTAHGSIPSGRKVIIIQGVTSDSVCDSQATNNMVNAVEQIRLTLEALPDFVQLNEGDVGSSSQPSDGGDFVYFSYAGWDPNSSAYCPGGVVPKYSADDTTANGVAFSAIFLSKQIQRLRAADPGVKIDIVAHSMGGAVASYWVTHYALPAELESIHSIITFDGVLQGIEDWKADGVIATHCFPFYLPDCTTAFNDMRENGPVMTSIRNGAPASRVPYVTISGHNAGANLFGFNIGDVVTDSKSTLPGVWLNFLGDMGDHSYLWAHPCGSCRELMDYALTHDLHDSRDTSASFAGSWGTISNDFWIKQHARTGTLGTTFSLSYFGSHAALKYSGLPFDNGSVNVTFDGTAVGAIAFSPCLTSSGGLGTCTAGYNVLCNGDHTIDVSVSSGTFILDAVETQPPSFSLPDCSGGPTVAPGTTGPMPDTSPPAVQCFVDPPIPPSQWFNSTVTVTCGASDPQSGISSASAGCGTTILANETGGTVITCEATNGAGLSASASSPIIRIDETPPVTTASLSPPTPNGKRGWYFSDVTVSLSASDPLLADGSPGSSVAATFYQVNGGGFQPYTVPFLVGAEGWNQVDFYSADVAGNVENTKNVRFKIDKTQPGISIASGTIDGIVWDQAHLQRGILTNQNLLALNGNATDNLCLWEVRAVDTDSGQTLVSQQPAGANTPDWPPPYPPSSLGYLLNVPLHTGINDISVMAEDCAGWTKAIFIQVVYVIPGPFDPRSKGFWYNAVKTGQYTSSQMQTFLSYINVASDVWGYDASRNRYGPLTLSNDRVILGVPNSTNMEQKMQAQLLANWLDMVSGRLAIKRAVNVSTIAGWPIVMDDIGGNPATFAYKVDLEIEELIQPAPASVMVDTVAKDLAEGINVRTIVVP